MEISYKKVLVVITLIIGVSFYVISNNDSNAMTSLEYVKFDIEKLQEKILYLNQENRTLNENLKISKQQTINLITDVKMLEGKLKSNLENNDIESGDEIDVVIKNTDSNSNKITDKENDFNTVDINKPFNGVDPASDKQMKKYSEFKHDIDGYEFNERFDMQGFLSDPRFVELHASLGVKLLDYVDKKLEGVALMQDNPEGAKMLLEIDD